MKRTCSVMKRTSRYSDSLSYCLSVTDVTVTVIIVTYSCDCLSDCQLHQRLGIPRIAKRVSIEYKLQLENNAVSGWLELKVSSLIAIN